MKKIIICVLIMLCVFGNIGITALASDLNSADKIKVNYITGVDGDTARFDYNGKNIKTRFLAIDTPEVAGENKIEEPYGNEARDFTNEKLKNAKEIELEFDSNADRQDNYGRYLVWVWVDGELLQDLLVQNGLAEVTYLYDDYKYTSKLQMSELKAKLTKVGMWGSEEEKSGDKTAIKDEQIEEKTESYEEQLKEQYQEQYQENEEGNVTVFGVIAAIMFLIFILLTKKSKNE